MKELLLLTPPTRDMSDWSQPLEGDPNCSPSLDLQLEYFLGGELPLLGAEGGDDSQQESMPQPFLDNSSEWVTWRANQVNIPTWWPELSMVSGERVVEECVQKIWASFELPRRRSCAWGTTNDYSSPPTPIP